MPVPFNRMEVGEQLPVLDKKTVTTVHLMRWCAATENFHRIHFDQAFAVDHDVLPGVLINGSFMQQMLSQLLKDGFGPESWTWRLKFRTLKMCLTGESLRAVGEVVAKTQVGDFGFVTTRLAILNRQSDVCAAGHAINVTPAIAGAQVPYPFHPSESHRQIRLPE